MIDTSQVSGRRVLRFATLDQMLDDARALAGADPTRLRRLGNWTLGQALNHVAAWMEFPYIGYPPGFDLPEEVKAPARAAKSRIMQETMKPGEHLPGLPAQLGGTLATEVVPTDVGLARLEAAATRLRSGEPTHVDPVFGRLTAEEWREMSLRHGELHLSFFGVG